MTCYLGGFLTVRYNDISDTTASLLRENVAMEPTLQPLSEETFSYLTANTATFPNLFFQLSFAPMHEQAKKREYGQHI